MEHKLIDFLQLDASRLVDEARTEFFDSASSTKKRKLKLTTDATHSGTIINDRVYPGKQVKASAKYFFKNEEGSKFDRPFLKNHDLDLDPIGRVVDAQYHATVTGTRWMNDYLEPTKEGSGFLRTTSHIMDSDAIDKFLDGRFQTVSVSATTDGVFCDKCTKEKGELVSLFSTWIKNDADEHQCNHMPGDVTDGKKNYIITGKMFYRELSQVNNPADSGGIHVGMDLLQDHLKDEGSVLSLSGKPESLEIIKTPVYASILDAEGNEVKSLNIKDFVPTKTISIPKTPMSKTNTSQAPRQEDTKSNISDEAFAEARILAHFKNYHGLELSDSDKEKVTNLDLAELTDTQKETLAIGFYLSKDLPFGVSDSETIRASHKLAERLFADETLRSTFLDAVVDQAKKENLTFNLEGIETMDEKQSKALLESLEDSKAENAKLKEQVEQLTAENKTLKDSTVESEVNALIGLRAQVGYADCKDFDSKSDEDKQALVTSYVEMSDEVRSHMTAEAKSNIEAGVVLASKLDDDKLDNPLEDVQDEGEDKEEIEDKENSESTPVIKNSKTTDLL